MTKASSGVVLVAAQARDCRHIRIYVYTNQGAKPGKIFATHRELGGISKQQASSSNRSQGRKRVPSILFREIVDKYRCSDKYNYVLA